MLFAGLGRSVLRKTVPEVFNMDISERSVLGVKTGNSGRTAGARAIRQSDSRI